MCNLMPTFSHFCRLITIQARDGDGASGPPLTVSITFDRNCTVLRDSRGEQLRILNIPLGYLDYQRVELCTAIGIERIEIANAESIRDLQFMRNVEVS